MNLVVRKAHSAAQGERHVNQGDEHGDFDERTHNAGERLSRRRTVGGDGNGDGQFEVVAGRGERQSSRAFVTELSAAPSRSRRPT